MPKIKKIALIGSGQLGSRHLQALAKIDMPVKIELMDISPESLSIANRRFLEMPFNENIRSITFTTDLEDLSANIDIGIIATTSPVRLAVLKGLLSNRHVSSLILEKVVFQSVGEFEQAKLLLDERGIDCWVNCPRRAVPFYKDVVELFQGVNQFDAKVTGGKWGLGCNGIHFIDFLAMCADECEYKLDIDGLDQCVLPSNREGFLEFTGRLRGCFSRGGHFNLESEANTEGGITITIEAPHAKVVINEEEGKAIVCRKETNWAPEEIRFKIPFQSEITQLIAKDLFETGSCCLTPFRESFLLHVPYLTSLIQHVEKIEKRGIDCCPIT